MLQYSTLYLLVSVMEEQMWSSGTRPNHLRKGASEGCRHIPPQSRRYPAAVFQALFVSVHNCVGDRGGAVG